MTVAYRLECRICCRHRFVSARSMTAAVASATVSGWTVHTDGDVCPRCIATKAAA